MIQAWYITGHPDDGVRHAIGPDEPDGEEFVLVSLSHKECESYIADHGMLGWARIMPLSLVEGHGGCAQPGGTQPDEGKTSNLQTALHDTDDVTAPDCERL